VTNVVQANLLAATTENPAALNQVYNVAVSGRTTLNELHGFVRDALKTQVAVLDVPSPVYQAFRPGDVRHSQADIGKARKLLGYEPTHDISAGLADSIGWYVGRFARNASGQGL
jgi:UDP-N-acetylglucosamine 4-epimerase